MDKHFMNKQHGRHMGAAEHKPSNEAAHGHNDEPAGGQAKPSIHVHSHANGHTVHILHPDGRHEKHEHEAGDAEGIAQHIHQHLGGAYDEQSEDDSLEHAL